MKVKPYRKCDICGTEYHKRHGIMEVKVRNWKSIFPTTLPEDCFVETYDLCPICAHLLIKEVKKMRGAE